MDGGSREMRRTYARGKDFTCVDELFDAGEGNDLIEAGFGFGARHAQDRGVKERSRVPSDPGWKPAPSSSRAAMRPRVVTTY